jgi:TRAP-type mannitol/chloroaromatic compound transport system substrate-binding protein
MSFMVNRAAWDGLPKAYQEAFEVAAAFAAQTTQAVYDVRNPEALARLVAGGTRLRRYSDEIMGAARREADDLLAQAAARDASGYARVYEEWRRFRDASQRWFATAEHEYSAFVLLNRRATP